MHVIWGAIQIDIDSVNGKEGMEVRDTVVVTTGFGIWLGMVREMEEK